MTEDWFLYNNHVDMKNEIVMHKPSIRKTCMGIFSTFVFCIYFIELEKFTINLKQSKIAEISTKTIWLCFIQNTHPTLVVQRRNLALQNKMYKAKTYSLWLKSQNQLK